MTHTAQNTAATKRTVSTSTEELITAKCQISDLHSLILNAVERVYGESQSNKYFDEIYESLTPTRDLIDRYIIESIDCNIGSLDSTEF
ncbi:MAG: hypothetical protein R3Y39_08070 [Rikenellaceae bacterium]